MEQHSHHHHHHHHHQSHEDQGSSPIGMLSKQHSNRRRNVALLSGTAASGGFSPPVTPQQLQQQQHDTFASIANGPIAVPSAPPSFIGAAPQIRNIFSLGGSGNNNASANGVSTGLSALQAMSAVPNQNNAGRASVSPGAKRNSIPLPTLPVTPSTPNGTNNNFAYPSERRSALWVLLHGQDDGVRNYQNPNNFQNFRPDQHQMLPQDQLLKPDDLTSLVLSEHIMNDNNDSSQGGMRYPMMPQMEPQPGTVDPTFTVPEWPRPDMGMEARNFPNLRAGLPELPNQMLFDGKAAGGILSPPTAFSNLPNNFFKMESNPYNTTLDFNVLNNYPAVDGQNGAGYPMDGFYNPYTAGLYENNPYAESYDCMNYGSQAPFNAGLIAQAQKPKQKNGKKQPKSKKSKGKPSWAEDASGGGSNSKRLRRNWTDDEERKFLEALEMYGRDWHKCAAHLQSRDVVSCRSHAQKYFIKLWINGEPLPKKVAEQGAGYTVSGKPLDPDSSFVKYYMSLFDKRRQGSISRNSSKSSVDESTAVSAS